MSARNLLMTLWKLVGIPDTCREIKLKQAVWRKEITYFLFCSSGGRFLIPFNLPASEIPDFPPCSGFKGCGQILEVCSPKCRCARAAYGLAWMPVWTPISILNSAASLKMIYLVYVWPPHGCGPLGRSCCGWDGLTE